VDERYKGDTYFPQLADIYLDKYHIIAGPYVEVKQFSAVVGIQYTWGRKQNTENLVNYEAPLEYIPEKDLALQGYPENTMNVKYNELSLFLGITYGFGK